MVDFDTRDRLAGTRLPQLAVGQALGDTFRVIRRAPLQLYALSLLVALASLPFGITYAQQVGPRLKALTTGAPQAAAPDASFFIVVGALYLLQIVVSIYVFGAVSAGTTRTLEEGRFGIGAALASGLRRFLPMLVCAIAFYLVLVLGLALLVVPGLLFGAAYGLAPALCVIERRGSFASFSRSAELTRGSRWQCLGVTVILTFVPGIVVAVLNGVLSVVVGQQNSLIVAPITNFFALPIFYVFPSVLAYDLRRLKEGGGPSAVAEVF